jgi:hypothetical protein
MDLLSLVRIFFRRWAVTVPIIVLTLAAATYVQVNVPPQYQARGSVLLATPELDPSRLPSSVVDLPSLVDELETEQTASGLVAPGSEILVRIREDGVFETNSVSTSAEAAEQTVENVIAWLIEEVARVQVEADVPESERIRARNLTPIVAAEEQDGNRYQATGAISLEDPSLNMTNPFGATLETALLLEEAVGGDAGRRRVADLTGPGASFQFSSADRSASPILRIDTFGSDPETVLEAFEHVRVVLDEELTARQDRAEVPTLRQVRVETLTAPGTVSDISPPVSRAVALIVGLGGLLALGLAIALESLLSRRSTRTSGVQPSEAVDWWPPTDDSPSEDIDDWGRHPTSVERTKASGEASR